MIMNEVKLNEMNVVDLLEHDTKVNIDHHLVHVHVHRRRRHHRRRNHKSKQILL